MKSKYIITPLVLIILCWAWVIGYDSIISNKSLENMKASEQIKQSEKELSKNEEEWTENNEWGNVGLQSTLISDYREFSSKQASFSKITDGLDAPWAFTWTPNWDILITEKFWSLQLFEARSWNMKEISWVPEVFASWHGWLLDITLHPNFSENNHIYLSYAHGTEEWNTLRVWRFDLIDNTLKNYTPIFETAQTKTWSSHFGSRFAWLPDNTLLFSVWDGWNPPTSYNGELIREQAQYLNSHLWKIIRVNDDGSVPEDNPYASRPDALPEIWSYGHRNSQWITFDTVHERVLASEHGSKWGDELNQLLSGQNYGWPKATFSTEYSAFSTPISESTSIAWAIDPLVAWSPTIAPSSLFVYSWDTYWEEVVWDIFVAGMLLRSSTSLTAYTSSPAGAIIHLTTDDSWDIISQSLIDVWEFRVRSIAEGPDGYLYVLTDATWSQQKWGKNGALFKIEEL